MSFIELGMSNDTHKILVSSKAYKRWQRPQLSLQKNNVLSQNTQLFHVLYYIENQTYTAEAH